MRMLWILTYCLMISKETRCEVRVRAKARDTVRLPCSAAFNEPVDWRYQKDATINEDYVCVATDQGYTNCEDYKKWPRVRVNVSAPGDYTLTIFNVTVSDSGFYYCIEEGGAGTTLTFQLNVLVPECDSNPCQNNGTCTVGDNWYTCACPDGITGTNCDSDLNECSSTPCQNDGVCFNGDNEYVCRCVPGFAGINCERYGPPDANEPNNRGMIIGILMSVTISVAVIVAVVTYCVRRRKLCKTRETDKETCSLITPTDVAMFTAKAHGVMGLTVLDEKLYVAYYKSKTLAIYSTQQSQPYKQLPDLDIDGLQYPTDIAASCTPINCLYIADWSGGCVWRVKEETEMEHCDIDLWSSVENVFGLSVATDGRVTMLIAVDFNPGTSSSNESWHGELHVYSSDGKHLTTINLPRDLANPHHAIETANNTFVVCHGDHTTDKNRVCEVIVHGTGIEKTNFEGTVQKSYGGLGGSGLGQLNMPYHMTLTDKGHILVVDYNNHRILMLNNEFQVPNELVLRTWSSDYPRPARVFYNIGSKELIVGFNDGQIEHFDI